MATHLAGRSDAGATASRAPRQWNRIVAHRAWLAVRDRALAGLARRPALVIVLGQAGTGKTVLLHELARVLRAGGIPAQLLSSARAPAAWEAVDPKTVLLLDDADALADDALARLASDDRRLVVLAARPQFGQRLDAAAPTATRLDLRPLEAAEVRGFLVASLTEAGRGAVGLGREVFSAAAVERLAARSVGVPRLLHDLAGTALFLADRDREDQVAAHHVDQAALVGEGGVLAAALSPRTASVPVRAPQAGVVADLPAPPAPMVPTRSLATPTRRFRAGWLLAVACLCVVAVGVVGWKLRPTAPSPASSSPASSSPASSSPASSSPASPSPASSSRPAPPSAAAAPAPSPRPATLSAPAAAPAAAPSAPVVATPPPVTRKPDPAAAPAAITVVPPSPVPAPGPAAPPAPPRVVPVPTVGAVAAPPLPALPVGALTTITVVFPAQDRHAALRATSLAAGLRQDGFAVAEPIATTLRAPPGTRYVFAEDRDAAVDIAAAAHRHATDLPAAATRQKPAEDEPAPHPGAITITLSGEGDSS